MMTKQAIFNRVKEHLLKQGARSATGRSLSGQDKCAYRGFDGMQCAVGCLITDDVYDPSLETLSVTHTDVRQALVDSGVLNPCDANELTTNSDTSPINLLCALQTLHDQYAPADWRECLADIAEKYGLA